MNSDSNPSQKAAQTAKGIAPATNGFTKKTLNVGLREQAAQLGDKVSDKVLSSSPNVPLDGGVALPIPHANKQPQKRDKNYRTPKARKDNKLSFRADLDDLIMINERMALTKCSESDAIRSLMREGKSSSPIVIYPRNPPDHLEAFMGSILRWQNDFHSVRSRLNAPLPKNPNDLKLIELVKGWREKSETALESLPGLLVGAEAESRALSRLTPEKIKALRELHKRLKGWIASREARLNDPAEDKDRETNLRYRNDYQMMKEIIEDLGLIPPEREGSE